MYSLSNYFGLGVDHAFQLYRHLLQQYGIVKCFRDDDIASFRLSDYEIQFGMKDHEYSHDRTIV